MLVLGSRDHFVVEGDGSFLNYYVPDLERDVITPLRESGHSPEDIKRLGGDPATSDLRV